MEVKHVKENVKFWGKIFVRFWPKYESIKYFNENFVRFSMKIPCIRNVSESA
jgi:hypothetical protein